MVTAAFAVDIFYALYCSAGLGAQFGLVGGLLGLREVVDVRKPIV